jgi:uncharacterized phage infection (PIP) family protein YhgE
MNEAARWSGFSGEIKRELKRLEDKMLKGQAQSDDKFSLLQKGQAQLDDKLTSLEDKLQNIAEMLKSSSAHSEPSRLTS